MESDKRTLRIVVEDNTKENPIPEKARIWTRGYGDAWICLEKVMRDRDVNIGTHSGDLCIHPGYVNREHPGFSVDFTMQPVMHKLGSVAYYAVGTICVEWFDKTIRVHGVPLGMGVLEFQREDKPPAVMDFDADCSQLLAEVVRKSDSRDQKLQDATVEIGRMKREMKAMRSVISNSEPLARLHESEQSVFRMLCAMNTASHYAVDRDELQKFCKDVYSAECPAGTFHPPYSELARNEETHNG